MLKSPYSNRKKPKNPREIYNEKVGRGRGLSVYADRKRKSMTHLKSMDDADIAYRSTSHYLRSVTAESEPDEPTDLQLIKSIPRTQSANELAEKAPKPNIGNPKLKTVEDYYDEVCDLRKELKAMATENNTLKTKNRRLEEDNKRKREEIDSLHDPNKDTDLVRVLATDGSSERGNTANVVMSLKKKLFRMECLLKEKENQIKQMEANPRWTRSGELQTANQALKNEIERLHSEKFLRKKNIDFGESLDDVKNFLVEKHKTEREKLENENRKLKEKLSELEESAKAKKSDDAERKLVEAESRAEEFRAKFDELKRKRNEEQDRIESLEKEKNQLQIENEKLQEKLRQEKQTQQNKFQSLKDSFDRSEDGKKQREKEMEKLRDDSRNLEEKNQTLEREIKNLRDVVRDLEEKNQTLEREKQNNKNNKKTRKDSSSSEPDLDESLRRIQQTIKGHSNRQKFLSDNIPSRSTDDSLRTTPNSSINRKSGTHASQIKKLSIDADHDSLSESRLTETLRKKVLSTNVSTQQKMNTSRSSKANRTYDDDDDVELGSN